MIGAAYPTIFYATEDKIGASVNAFAVQRPDAVRVVAKEDYVAALEKSEDLYELARLPPLSDDAPAKLSFA